MKILPPYYDGSVFIMRKAPTCKGIKTFEHHTDERNSAYLMLRKTELDKNTFSIKDIENFFRDIYMLS